MVLLCVAQSTTLESQKLPTCSKTMASLLEVTKSEEVQLLTFKAKFQGNIIEVPPLDGSTCCVLDLKRFLEDETSVPIIRQKLIGLIKGKLPNDETLLKDLFKSSSLSKEGVMPPISFTLMGTPDDKLFIDPSERNDLPEVFDDFDNLNYEIESKRWHRSKRNARKVYFNTLHLFVSPIISYLLENHANTKMSFIWSFAAFILKKC